GRGLGSPRAAADGTLAGARSVPQPGRGHAFAARGRRGQRSGRQHAGGGGQGRGRPPFGMRVSAAPAEVRAKGWYQTTPNLPRGYRTWPATEDERPRGAPMAILEINPLAAPRVLEVF